MLWIVNIMRSMIIKVHKMNIDTTVREVLSAIDSRLQKLGDFKGTKMQLIKDDIEAKFKELRKVSEQVSKFQTKINSLTKEDYTITEDITYSKRKYLFFKETVTETVERFCYDKVCISLAGDRYYNTLRASRHLEYRPNHYDSARDFIKIGCIEVNPLETCNIYLHVGGDYEKVKDYAYHTAPFDRFNQLYPKYKTLVDELKSFRKEIKLLQDSFSLDKVIILDSSKTQLLVKDFK